MNASAFPVLVAAPTAPQEEPPLEGLAAVIARVLELGSEMELLLSIGLALILIGFFVLAWLGLLWVPYRLLVAARRHFERGRTAGRELEWLRFRLRDVKRENRELRERLAEYEQPESYFA